MKTGTIFFIVIFIMVVFSAIYLWKRNRLKNAYDNLNTIGDPLAYKKCIDYNKTLSPGSACRSCGPNGVGDFNGVMDANGRCVIR